MTLPYAHPTLRREVGLFGAVMLGLGSILGTGVFVALPLKTAEAGLWIIPAIVVAGLVALCNALSSAQLAAAHPVAGGTYEYGYRFLKPWLGFTAGWTFLLAKSASAATAALGVMIGLRLLSIGTSSYSASSYIGPTGTVGGPFTVMLVDAVGFSELVPFAVVVLISACCLIGIRRTLLINTLIVAFTLAGLVTFVFRVVPWDLEYMTSNASESTRTFSLSKLAGSTAFCFVAFTGYGRLATLGEEVHNPRRAIPQAIVATLILCIAIYLAVGLAALQYAFPADPLACSLPYFASITSRSLGVIVSLAAVTAMLGVLLNLILGLSRVWLAMARRGDAPAILARIHGPTSTPRPAVVLTGVVIAALVLVGDVRLTWSFSAFTVLIYYAITNWAALKLPPEHRLYPRWIAWCGLIACALLAWVVDWQVWAAGVAIILVGLAWHAFRRWMNHRGHGEHGGTEASAAT